MPESAYATETRQKTEEVFSTATPLGGSATFSAPPRTVAGYDIVSFFGISDLAFQVRIEESCSADGPWVPTHTLASVTDSETGLEKVCDRVAPCGKFMQAFIDNLSASPETTLEFCALGIPEASV